MARLEKKQKEDWEKSGGIDTDQDLEDSVEDEVWTSESEVSKKKKKRSRKTSTDKGRGDIDFEEKQKFHPKQVWLAIHLAE